MSAREGRLEYAALTDVGLVRAHNEDAALAEPPLFAVADGLGGHSAGEVASAIAIETLRAQAPRTLDPKALGRSVHEANRAVIEAADEGRGRAGMGTTVTAAVVSGTRIALAQVGDSRAYLLGADGLERLTEDHSLVADMVRRGTLTETDARSHPNRSVITRALGSDPNMYADTYDIQAEPGDRLILTTDGLTGMLTDAEIEQLLAANPDPEHAVRALVDAANAEGGHDNITVVVVNLEGKPATRDALAAAVGATSSAADFGAGRLPASTAGAPAARSREDRVSSARAWFAVIAFVVAGLLILAGGAYLTWNYARSQAYLTSEDGVVVVYRGLPGELAGVTLRWREIETTIPVDALDPVIASRLQGALRVDNMTAARALLDEYRQQVAPEGDSETPGGVLTPEPLPPEAPSP